MKFNLDIDKYFWNVVYINGIWGLVDVDWVVRGIIKKFRKFYYWLDEYYFFFDFYYFICVYFFNDKQWQLLERFIMLDEFENMLYIKFEFFMYGLEIVSYYFVIIYG